MDDTLGEWDDNTGRIECFMDVSVQFMDKPALIMRPLGPAQ
jgi:hypothetical protein